MDNFINISRLKFEATASGELDFLIFSSMPSPRIGF